MRGATRRERGSRRKEWGWRSSGSAEYVLVEDWGDILNESGKSVIKEQVRSSETCTDPQLDFWLAPSLRLGAKGVMSINTCFAGF